MELVLLGVAGGLLGAWVVLRRLAFFAHAVGTATFPGLVVADAAGFSAPRRRRWPWRSATPGGVERAGRARRDPGDAATALLLVGALALRRRARQRRLRVGRGGGQAAVRHAARTDGADLAFSGAAAAAALAGTALLGRAWLAAGFDPAGARRARPAACARGPAAARAGGRRRRRGAARGRGAARRPRCSSCPAARRGCSRRSVARAAARGRRHRRRSRARSASTSRLARRPPGPAVAVSVGRLRAAALGAPLRGPARSRGATCAPSAAASRHDEPRSADPLPARRWRRGRRGGPAVAYGEPRRRSRRLDSRSAGSSLLRARPQRRRQDDAVPRAAGRARAAARRRSASTAARPTSPRPSAPASTSPSARSTWR